LFLPTYFYFYGCHFIFMAITPLGVSQQGELKTHTHTQNITKKTSGCYQPTKQTIQTNKQTKKGGGGGRINQSQLICAASTPHFSCIKPPHEVAQRAIQ
jgi:hypothetical protein